MRFLTIIIRVTHRKPLLIFSLRYGRNDIIRGAVIITTEWRKNLSFFSGYSSELYPVVCVCQCKDTYLALASFLNRLGAACKGGACGKDVVNEQNVLSLEQCGIR